MPEPASAAPRQPATDPGPTSRPLAESPREIERDTWQFALRRTWRKFWVHQCTDLAASLTYYGVLGVFPALIVLVSVLGLAGQQTSTVTIIIDVLQRVAPPVLTEVAQPLLEGLIASRHGWGLVFGIIGALYTGSRYVRAFGRALNRIYGVREGRRLWRLEGQMLAITLLVGTLGLLAVALLVISGPVADVVGRIAGVGPTAVVVWDLVKWPAVLVVAVIIVAILYYATPNVRQPHWHWVSVGALLALVIWSLASAGFGVYVVNFSRYDATYGSLAGVIVFLVWLWVTNIAVLIGAVLDCELERARELEAGLPAETDLQLPLRDTRLITKMDRIEAANLARAHALRAEEPADAGTGAAKVEP